MKKIGLSILAVILFIPFAFCQDDCAQQLGKLPLIKFNETSLRLTDETKSSLANVAALLRQHPACKLVVTGVSGKGDEAVQLSWDRVNVVINRYLIDREGIAPERLIFKFGKEKGEDGTVELSAATAGEDGPLMPAAPFPDLRRSR